MIPDGEARALLDFLPEPAFILRRHGEVLMANAAARRLLGADPRSRSLFDHIGSPHDEFDDYLRRCSGTTSPMIGSVTFRTGGDPAGFRAHCARLRDSDAEPRLALRCTPERNDQFSVLAARVRNLNVQLRQRLREKAVLEEALSENRTLLRELQHRVKNNIQMMMSLVCMSARGRENPHVREVVETARLRLQAMASTQEAIYRSRRTSTVAAGAFLEQLLAGIGQSVEPSARLKLDVADAELTHEVAHALALIANELVTNAIKHGLNGGGGSIDVSLERLDGELQLVVHDSGPGLEATEAASRSSGLRLVRGLCRQIGGALEIANENGARCTVRFSEKTGGR